MFILEIAKSQELCTSQLDRDRATAHWTGRCTGQDDALSGGRLRWARGAVAVQWLGEKNNDFFFYAVGLHYLCKKIKKMKSSLVSILIPAYNAAPFLERSVASALGQSYAGIEVVIVDDG